MSTTATPSPASPTPPAPPTPPAGYVAATAPRPARSGGRRAAIWLGGAAALFGALIAHAGGAVFAVFGSDGVLKTDRQALSTPTSALTSGTASIDSGGSIDDFGGARIAISANADGDQPVFVGVGRADAVDRYLAGAATDEVTDFNAGPFDDSFDIERERHNGSATPAAPGDQSFWVAQSSGTDSAKINWKVRDGDYRIVVMNADGTRGVATQSTLGVEVPWAPGVGIGILVGGLLLTAGGIAAITMGARRPRA
jgi:hypothetical protein